MGLITREELNRINRGFDIEEFGDNVSMVTRDNGDVGEEEYSDIDYSSGLEIIKSLKEDFNIIAKISTCDEWVFVNFKNTDNKRETEMLRLKAEVVKAQNNLDKMVDGVFNKIKNQKSLKKTCKNCESNISVSYLQNCNCPVCGIEMFSNTEQIKYHKLIVTLREKREKLNDFINDI